MKQLLRLNKDGKLALRDADGTEKVVERRPVNVLLLLDTSGSMAGTKIEQARSGAIEFALSAAKKGYKTALAIFADRAAMVCDPVGESARFAQKVAKVDVGLVGGSTNLAAGLLLAQKFDELAAVVLVTDGHCDDDQAAFDAAILLKNRGTEIICIGTDDADSAFLARLSTRLDLAAHVPSQQLRTAISEASRMLPRG